MVSQKSRLMFVSRFELFDSLTRPEIPWLMRALFVPVIRSLGRGYTRGLAYDPEVRQSQPSMKGAVLKPLEPTSREKAF